MVVSRDLVSPVRDPTTVKLTIKSQERSFGILLLFPTTRTSVAHSLKLSRMTRVKLWGNRRIKLLTSTTPVGEVLTS